MKNQIIPEVRNEIKLINNNGVIFGNSREVATNFGKNHKEVLRSIENIRAQNCAVLNMFIESTYVAKNGKHNKEYLMTRDGFSLLVMGFTGSKALDWKVKYIDAFNKMESHIRNNLPKISREQELELKILAGNSVDVFELKEYKDKITHMAALKASDGTDKLMTLTQITHELNNHLYNPMLTTTVLSEFLSDVLDLGEYKRVGKDKKRSFVPNDKFQEVITKTGGSFTGKTNRQDKIKIQFSKGMLDYILQHKSQLEQYINEIA